MDSNQVMGKALYMELRNGGQTYQLMLTPDGFATDGRYVPATIYRRQISASKPRRAWKTIALPSIKVNAFGAFDKVPHGEAIAEAENRMKHMYQVISRLKDYGYKLYKKAIIVEVSAEDMNDIRQSKTPYKVLGRITRVRRTLGFSENLFAE